ncbi:MAG: glycosyltransferase family 2 protein [Bacteroidota bacterium]
MPKVSVILPFYQAGTTLERAVRSVMGQTFSNWECLLVDNNSTDGGEKIARQYAAKDRRFRLLTEKNQGVVHAFYRGEQEARGVYVARMDADDWAHPKRIEKQLAWLEAHPETGAVATQVEYVAHHNNTDGFARFVQWNNCLLTYEQMWLNRFVELPLVNPTAMWRKDLAEKLGSYRAGNFPEDYEMWLRWMEAGIRVDKLPEKLLYWHDSDTRLTRTHQIYSDEAFFRIKSHYLSNWLRRYQHHKRIYVWGASRISRKRVEKLEAEGITVESFIDIKQSRQLERPVLFYEDLPEPGTLFILVYMKLQKAREKIQAFLHERGYIEGKDYLLVA